MMLLKRLLLLLATAMVPGVSMPAPAALDTDTGKHSGEATLHYMNRDIMVFRGTLAGTPPALRVERAGRRLREHAASGETDTLSEMPVSFGSQQGIGIGLNGVLLFTVIPEDVDPESGHSLQEQAREVQAKLRDALEAHHEQADIPNLLRSLLFVVLALALAALATRQLRKARTWLLLRLEKRYIGELTAQKPWLLYLTKVIERVVQILTLLLIGVIAYLWLTWALGQFPLTRPFGDRLGEFLMNLLGGFASAAVRAIPDLIALVIILLITRTLAQSVHSLFDAVQSGRIELPGIYRETAGATRRIINLVIWALGIVFCYPYIPGSQSDVFKGLSVLFGFMLTLGSAGVVSQLMSGMTLIYSRALRVGDLVQIGDNMGVVREVGTLSTKLVNIYNEIVTIPNVVVIAHPVRNLSRLNEGPGVMIGATVTIGYDTPWRQVEAMLLNAARATPGLRGEPRVLQRSLDDYYVRYELQATLNDPMARLFVLSTLNANIQDEFNRHGVQIMSPNFVAQPPGGPVLVPESNWHATPAKPATDKG